MSRHRSHSQRRQRRGASLLEALAVVGLSGIVISVTSMTLARVAALNRTAEHEAVRSQTRHRFFRQLRGDIHAASSATIAKDQTLSLADFADGRSRVDYSLQKLQQAGWAEKVRWRVAGREVAIQPVAMEDAESVLFAAQLRRRQIPLEPAADRLLPPLESLESAKSPERIQVVGELPP